MPDIHIQRDHSLGLPEARKIAFRWAQQAEERLEMACTYEEGKTSDRVSFSRSGVNGELKVTRDSFQLQARLGLLLGAFKDRIEREIVKNLDELLGQQAAPTGARGASQPRAVRKATGRRGTT